MPAAFAAPAAPVTVFFSTRPCDGRKFVCFAPAPEWTRDAWRAVCLVPPADSWSDDSYTWVLAEFAADLAGCLSSAGVRLRLLRSAHAGKPEVGAQCIDGKWINLPGPNASGWMFTLQGGLRSAARTPHDAAVAVRRWG